MGDAGFDDGDSGGKGAANRLPGDLLGGEADIARSLRAALTDFTVDRVNATLGADGREALGRGDSLGVRRALDTAAAATPITTLIRLFLLGSTVSRSDAQAAMDAAPVEAAVSAGLLSAAPGGLRAAVEIRPYAEAGADAPPWWVASDFGADVRHAPLRRDHVLGLGSASLTLAQLTPRRQVGRALDVGTGCGVQALHLARHAAHVVATDISERALRFAATTATLSGQTWEQRAGSLLDPIRPGETFDLIVANPPFVVSDGAGGSAGGGYDYRDGGRAGDAFCAALVREIPRALAPNGSAHLLANWLIPGGTTSGGTVGSSMDWTDRVGGWLADTGCDAWVWQREVVEPSQYVTLWLRDAGLTQDHPDWAARYTAWLDWFAANQVAAIGMGYVAMWSTTAPTPIRVLEDVAQEVELPAGDAVADWITRQRWLAATSTDALLASRLLAAPGLVLDRSDVLGLQGWQAAAVHLRQSSGLRWQVEVDDAVAGLVAACTADVPLGVLVSLLAASVGRPTDEVVATVSPVVRDLVGRGFLCPPELGPPLEPRGAARLGDGGTSR